MNSAIFLAKYMYRYWYLLLCLIAIIISVFGIYYFFDHQTFFFVSCILLLLLAVACLISHFINRKLSKNHHDDLKQYVDTSIKHSEERIMGQITEKFSKITKLAEYFEAIDEANGELAGENNRLEKLVENYKKDLKEKRK